MHVSYKLFKDGRLQITGSSKESARLLSIINTSIFGGFTLLCALAVSPTFARAQYNLDAIPASSSAALPDAPGFTSSAVGTSFNGTSFDPAALEPLAAGAGAQTPNQPKVAGRYDKYISPGQMAPSINAHDKFILGVRDAVSPFSIFAWLFNGAYEMAVDGSPNYGQTGRGFAQRLGAAAARDVSQGIFGDSILAPLLHEDPRYYKLGKGHSFIKRVVYSGSRAIITRTDGGRHTINLAQIGGNLGGALLTDVYYPPINQGFTQTMETFGGSVGGSALGFVVSEFLSDTLVAVHLKHSD